VKGALSICLDHSLFYKMAWALFSCLEMNF
jgi:hypothetical protein